MIRVRSAGPLISKFLNNEFARKRSKVSSIMSAWDGSAVVTISTRDDCDALMLRTDGCWPPYPGSNGQNGGVADLPGVWFFIEGRVVGLSFHYQDEYWRNMLTDRLTGILVLDQERFVWHYLLCGE